MEMYYMIGLRNLLLQEQERLEKILQKATEQMKDAPQGRLRLTNTKQWVQYYHCVPGGKRSGKYISKTNETLIQALAQKSYNEKILKLVEKRLAQIKNITEDYDEKEIEKVFWNENAERRKLIQPVEPTWEQQLKQWTEKEYKGKEFQEGTPVILTDQGERVRSKSEKILADYFYKKKISYKYERPLYLKNFTTVYPDFTFLSQRTGKEIYWEHHGKMEDPAYMQNTIRKIHAYEENGIYPGESLILTFETGKTVLNMQIVERLVHRYLEEQ